MRRFKDQVQSDITNVFLNEDHFAEIHAIEGKDTVVIYDADRLQKMKTGQILGMVEADILLYGKTESLPVNTEPGCYWNVDGRELIITASGTDMGMTEVALKQNRRG